MTQAGVYERICSENFKALSHGAVVVNAALSHPTSDLRSGVGTLTPVRSCPGTYASLVKAFETVPGQYAYPFGDLAQEILGEVPATGLPSAASPGMARGYHR